MERLKITWITGSNFFNVDEPLMHWLKYKFEIYWIVLVQFDDYSDVGKIKSSFNEIDIQGEVIQLRRMRSFSTLKIYRKIITVMKKLESDFYYIDCLGMPYLFPMLSLMKIDSRKVIYACHDFEDHVNIKYRSFITKYKKYIFYNYTNIKLFSQTQLHLFQKAYPNANAFYTPLVLQQYGKPTIPKKQYGDLPIVFLFYGTIRENKGLEILIEAVNSLPDKYKGKFLVKIWGGTDKWKYYSQLIQNISNFELRIERIPDEDVANLFAASDYLILPYRDVSQSGPLSVACYYNVPVIASNHDGFKEFIVHGENGFLFENENYSDLAMLMRNIIDGMYNYDDIKKSQKRFVDRNLSTSRIIEMYEKGFYDLYKEIYKK